MKKMLPTQEASTGAAEIRIILPSLKVSGGIVEAVKLGYDLQETGAQVGIIAMWKSAHEVPIRSFRLHALSKWSTRLHLAPFELPVLIYRFYRLLQSRNWTHCHWIFTHYATLPLALLVPRERRWFFVQGLEWKFINNKILGWLLRKVIISVYRRSNLLSANSYLANALQDEGLIVRAVAPIWADPRFDSSEETERNIDVLMILRKGGCKRLDLYLEAINWFVLQAPYLRIGVITTEDEIGKLVHNKVAECYVRPNGPEVMRAIYRRSKLLLHLSEHEGFALPPLEAMGSGCVPLCRDSGGPQAYMSPPLDALLFSLDRSVDSLCHEVVEFLGNPVRWKEMSEAARNNFRYGMKVAGRRLEVLAPLFSNH